MKHLLDYSERALLVLLFAAAAIANWQSHDPRNLLLLVGHVLTVGFLLFRRRGSPLSEHPVDWLFAAGATMLPMLLRPSAGSVGPELLADGLLWAGAFVSIFAKLSLNTRFGFVPANRGVQARWAYALVRHPMYLGYLLAEAGYLMLNPSWRNMAILAVVWPLQIARILREERWLGQDPDYRIYQGQVRYRLVPGLF
jgi:protein-S-isoprenylcysteine O-methyltransferase Ste14